MHTTGGYLTQVAFTHKFVFDLHPETDVYLVHGRRRLGHRAQLHRLRPAGQRRDQRDVRRCAQLPGQRSAVGDHREVQGHQVLYGPDSHPYLHEVGSSRTGQTRPVVVAAPRVRRRADQPGSVDVVSREHRRRHMPGGRYLVADRDRGDHDQPVARSHHHKAGFGHVPSARYRRRGCRRHRSDASTGVADT